MEHAGLAARALAEQAAPRPGVREWLDALGKFNVPCALVSSLDRGTVRAALARMTLHDHFSAMVRRKGCVCVCTCVCLFVWMCVCVWVGWGLGVGGEGLGVMTLHDHFSAMVSRRAWGAGALLSGVGFRGQHPRAADAPPRGGLRSDGTRAANHPLAARFNLESNLEFKPRSKNPPGDC